MHSKTNTGTDSRTTRSAAHVSSELHRHLLLSCRDIACQRLALSFRQARTLTSHSPRLLLHQTSAERLEQFDVRPQARLFPPCSVIALVCKLVELNKQLAHCRNCVGIESVDLVRQERDTDTTCASERSSARGGKPRERRERRTCSGMDAEWTLEQVILLL